MIEIAKRKLRHAHEYEWRSSAGGRRRGVFTEPVEPVDVRRVVSAGPRLSPPFASGQIDWAPRSSLGRGAVSFVTPAVGASAPGRADASGVRGEAHIKARRRRLIGLSAQSSLDRRTSDSFAFVSRRAGQPPRFPCTLGIRCWPDAACGRSRFPAPASRRGSAGARSPAQR